MFTTPIIDMDQEMKGKGLELFRESPLTPADLDCLMAAEQLIMDRISYPPSECFRYFDPSRLYIGDNYTLICTCVTRTVELEHLRRNSLLDDFDEKTANEAHRLYLSELRRALAIWLPSGHSFWHLFNNRMSDISDVRPVDMLPERHVVRHVYGIYFVPVDLIKQVTKAKHQLELELLEQSLLSALTGMLHASTRQTSALQHFRFAADLSRRLQNSPYVDWVLRLTQHNTYHDSDH